VAVALVVVAAAAAGAAAEASAPVPAEADDGDGEAAFRCHRRLGGLTNTPPDSKFPVCPKIGLPKTAFQQSYICYVEPGL